ncbi:uncharacterized protein LOC128231153 [Mya arenaria]|uniref:uncharacterized protein LOC128231153 n=1 Tax=Mya arenaria TaxID=6604 RepID=UPI0022E69C56|nr:uncharacterized protein LOC128231153 [Mya arenaria]
MEEVASRRRKTQEHCTEQQNAKRSAIYVEHHGPCSRSDSDGHQPRSSYKRSGVYMDDADERRPLLSKEELAEQIEDCHRRIIEREQEYERRAENLEDAAAQFEKIPPRSECACCKRCCTIL